MWMRRRGFRQRCRPRPRGSGRRRCRGSPWRMIVVPTGNVAKPHCAATASSDSRSNLSKIGCSASSRAISSTGGASRAVRRACVAAAHRGPCRVKRPRAEQLSAPGPSSKAYRDYSQKAMTILFSSSRIRLSRFGLWVMPATPCVGAIVRNPRGRSAAVTIARRRPGPSRRISCRSDPCRYQP